MNIFLFVIYLSCFFILGGITLYNWLYAKQAKKVKELIGVVLPQNITTLLHINIFVALGTSAIVSLLLFVFLLDNFLPFK